MLSQDILEARPEGVETAEKLLQVLEEGVASSG